MKMKTTLYLEQTQYKKFKLKCVREDKKYGEKLDELISKDLKAKK